MNDDQAREIAHNVWHKKGAIASQQLRMRTDYQYTPVEAQVYLNDARSEQALYEKIKHDHVESAEDILERKRAEVKRLTEEIAELEIMIRRNDGNS